MLSSRPTTVADGSVGAHHPRPGPKGRQTAADPLSVGPRPCDGHRKLNPSATPPSTPHTAWLGLITEAQGPVTHLHSTQTRAIVAVANARSLQLMQIKAALLCFLWHQQFSG
eukprot:353716-Chlamydomonas_euryale.AAC.8